MAERSRERVAFGRAVRWYRKRAGLSQEELGYRAKLHRTEIGHVERAEKNFGIETVVKVAHGLEVRLPDLMRRAEELLPKKR